MTVEESTNKINHVLIDIFSQIHHFRINLKTPYSSYGAYSHDIRKDLV